MRLPKDSLRVRLLTIAGAWVLVGLALAGVLIIEVFRSRLTEQFRTDLEVHLAEFSTGVGVDALGNPILRYPISDPRFLSMGPGYYWQVERDGRRPLRSPSLGDFTLSGRFAAAASPQSGETDGPRGRLLEYGRLLKAPDGGPPLRLSIAAELNSLASALESFRQLLGSILAVFGIVFLAGTALQLTYGLRPLDRLGRAIARMREDGRPLEEGAFPSEVRPLVHDLRTLLAANQAMVQRARIQAGNLAHGLRTPLAIVLDEAERLERRGEVESAHALFDQCRRMQQQIDYHMARSRAAAAIPSGRVTRIAPAVEPILTAMNRLHGSRGVVFVNSGGPDLTAGCDPVDFGEIVSALLDNAGKWASTGVTVSWKREGARLVIAIDDDGPGLEPALREKAFAVGQRLDEGVSGSGLGLAIARDLAGLYDGSVHLEDVAGGSRQGLRAKLVLPLSGQRAFT